MAENIVEVKGLTHYFKLNKKVGIKALNNISFQIKINFIDIIVN